MRSVILLFLLISFSANAADDLCVENNVDKCKELGYTETSCPNGGVACQYDKSLWHCAQWNCADGRLFTEENKLDENCGNCVETAYKNLNCYECKENSCSSTTCAVGDVYYSDGTCCPVENFDCKKTPVGVVYALSATKGGIPYTTAEAEAMGFVAQHGRIISLSDLTSDSATYSFNPENPYNNSDSQLHFGLNETDVSGLTNYNSPELMLAAFQNGDKEIYSGKENTTKFATATPQYSSCKNGSYAPGTAEYKQYCAPTAAKATLSFYPPEVSKTHPTIGAGNWYLPAIGELALLQGIDVNQMTAGTGTSGSTGTTIAIVNNTLTALKNKGVYAQRVSTGFYWSSVEYRNVSTWRIDMAKGNRTGYVRSKYYVRAGLEF